MNSRTVKLKQSKQGQSAPVILPAPGRATVDADRVRKAAAMPHLDCAGLSDRGRIRGNNEDNWCADPQMGLFLVTDGMGGQSAGALASKIVVEVLPLLIRQRMEGVKDLALSLAGKRLRTALCELSRQLRARTQGEPGLAGMGATVVLALVHRHKALIAHMGDSRAYLLRHGQLKRLTNDHTIVQLLIDNGEITAEEAGVHPARSQLTRFVGMPGEPLPELQFLELCAGDRLLLCTDGLTGMLSDEHLCSTLGRRASIEAICKQLVDAANTAGGRDNITVVLLQVVSPPGRVGLPAK